MRRDTKVFCNQCGKELREQSGRLEEGCCHVEQRWGYFSDKDMEVHTFDLCEDCYDQLTAAFLLPIKVEQQIEL